MRLLVVTPRYPTASDASWGSVTERFALSLRDLGNEVEILAPRPYAPASIASAVGRWERYRRMARDESVHGLSVYRPSYLHVPWLGGRIWDDPGTFLFCRRWVTKRHRSSRFDAVVSVDLVGAGGLAWRLGQSLGIPASGWAIGGDVHLARSASSVKVLRRAVANLDLVFYQSRDLLNAVAQRVGLDVARMPPSRHIVLPRGVPQPPALPRAQVRSRVRAEWGVGMNQVVVLNVGRLVTDKGVFELLQAMCLVSASNPEIICVLLGAAPRLDETKALERFVAANPRLESRVRIIPTCAPETVWEYLCGADIFAFPSRREGMPNSLLEAMIMAIPAVAFDIRAVLELENGTGCLLTVPERNVELFADAILGLASAPAEREQLGEKGRARVSEGYMLRNSVAEVLRRLRQLVEQRRPGIGSSSASVVR